MNDPKRCMGMNCEVPTKPDHSAECVAEHAASVAGGWFVKSPNISAEVLGLIGGKIVEMEHGLGYSPEQRDYVLPVLHEIQDKACALTDDRVKALTEALHRCADALPALREGIKGMDEFGDCEMELADLDVLIADINELLTEEDEDD